MASGSGPMAWTVYHDPDAPDDRGWFVGAMDLINPGKEGGIWAVESLAQARAVIRLEDPDVDFRMGRLASDPEAVVETWI